MIDEYGFVLRERKRLRKNPSDLEGEHCDIKSKTR